MSFKSQTEVLIKGAIGATGTFTSVILETVSVVISIIAGIATTLYMVQSWRNARDKGEAFKEDRNNGNLLERLKTTLFFAAAILLAAVSIWWTFTTFVEFSGFAAAFAKAVIGITAWFAFDKIVLREIDTITEIKKGNTAHAIFIFSYAIILAACIATA